MFYFDLKLTGKNQRKTLKQLKTRFLHVIYKKIKNTKYIKKRACLACIKRNFAKKSKKRESCFFVSITIHQNAD